MPGSQLNSVIHTYSVLADQYDEPGNLESCWGRAADRALQAITLKPGYSSIVDVGCGTGRALAELAPTAPNAEMIGLEPAANMLRKAQERTARFPHVRIAEGRFEEMPLPSASADYLYSILAFHWTTDVDKSVSEIARVLKPSGEADLTFIGRQNGREFIRATTPIFLKYMGPAGLLRAAGLRKQLAREAAEDAFGRHFAVNGPRPRCEITESYTTYFDTLEGHWNWWVRIEGQMIDIPPEKREACDRDVKAALAALATDQGVPYTIHLLHVRIRES
jgi:ubiquinone/menaquinone biosynthesis C-methylase UbiE